MRRPQDPSTSPYANKPRISKDPNRSGAVGSWLPCSRGTRGDWRNKFAPTECDACAGSTAGDLVAMAINGLNMAHCRAAAKKRIE